MWLLVKRALFVQYCSFCPVLLFLPYVSIMTLTLCSRGGLAFRSASDSFPIIPLEELMYIFPPVSSVSQEIVQVRQNEDQVVLLAFSSLTFPQRLWLQGLLRFSVQNTKTLPLLLHQLAIYFPLKSFSSNCLDVDASGVNITLLLPVRNILVNRRTESRRSIETGKLERLSAFVSSSLPRHVTSCLNLHKLCWYWWVTLVESGLSKERIHKNVYLHVWMLTKVDFTAEKRIVTTKIFKIDHVLHFECYLQL